MAPTHGAICKRPRKRKRKEKGPKIDPKTGKNVDDNILDGFDTDNTYSSLADTESDKDMQIDNTTTHKKRERKPVNRTAPIVVVGSNATAVQTSLTTIVLSQKFGTTYKKSGIRVTIPDEKEHQAYVDYLNKNSIGYFFYYTAETRPRKYVLYGLQDMDVNELKNTLNDLKVPFSDVKKLQLSKKQYDWEAIYLLYFQSGKTNLNELRKVKAISNVIVRWDHFHPRNVDQVPQCYNCQRMGHSSANCHLPPRCVVCAENHGSDKCPKKISRAALKLANAFPNTEIDRSFVKCCNCGENHAASYRSCKIRQGFIESHKRTMQRNVKTHNHSGRGFNYNADDFPGLSHGARPNVQPQVQVNTKRRGMGPQRGPLYSEVSAQSNTPGFDLNMLFQMMQSMMTMMNNMMEKLSQVVNTLALTASNHHGVHK